MLRYHFLIAIRNLLRQKGYSFVNIAGLAIGIAAALLILSYVRVDLTWDSFHPNADRIVRLVEKQNFGGEELTDVAWIMPAIGPALVEELPEVEAQCLIMSTWGRTLLQRDETMLYEGGAMFVDSTFFRIFGFELEAGDKETALARHDGIVLSKETASQYFEPGENPVGQTLLLNGEHQVTVTGVLADPPAATHIRLDVLIPFQRASDYTDFNPDSWGNNNHACYLLLSHVGMDLDELGEKVTEVYHRHGSWEGLIFWAQPLSEMHLHSTHIELDGHNYGTSSMAQVYTLISISVLILLIACINFVNLSTARAARRAREVGLRKVTGARRFDLVLQFLGESLFVALLAMVLAGVIVQLTAPFFEQLVRRETPINVLDFGFATFTLLALALASGTLAGLYPAFVLSSFAPMKVLRGSGKGTVSTGGSVVEASAGRVPVRGEHPADHRDRGDFPAGQLHEKPSARL